MIKVMMFIHRRPDLTFDEFRAHYEGTHVPLALSRLGYLRRYIRNYFPPREGVSQPCDCVTELWFDDVESLQKQSARMANDPALSDDELKFMDRPRLHSSIVEEIETRIAPDMTA